MFNGTVSIASYEVLRAISKKKVATKSREESSRIEEKRGESRRMEERHAPEREAHFPVCLVIDARYLHRGLVRVYSDTVLFHCNYG